MGPVQLAVNDMVARTSTRNAPWNLVEANDKNFARDEGAADRERGAEKGTGIVRPAPGPCRDRGAFIPSGTYPGHACDCGFRPQGRLETMGSPAPTPVGTTGGGRQAVRSLSAWRERVVRMLARSSALLVVVAYPPSIWLSIVNGFPSLVVIDTMACAGLLLAALRPSLPYRVRAGLFLACFTYWPWSSSFRSGCRVPADLVGDGPGRGGALLGMRGAIVALSVMGGTVALFGHWDRGRRAPVDGGPGHVADGQDLTVWFVNATNALLLSSGAALSAQPSFADSKRRFRTWRKRPPSANGRRATAPARGQLRQAQKLEAVGRLAGGIAHDFNNLLTPIVAYTEDARHDLPPDSKAAQQLGEVLRSAQRAGHLVRRILTFSRHSVLTRVPVRVADVVREAGALLRATLPTSIAIRYEISAEHATVVADAAELHQVLMNLGTNALDAMQGHGGTLEFGVQQSGTCVEITVRDTGCGMDAQVLEHAFEPFFTTKPQGKGTGLGLATSHSIVQSLGGQVWLASEPGAGTTVTLSLPLIKSTDASPAGGRSAPPSSRQRRAHPAGGR